MSPSPDRSNSEAPVFREPWEAQVFAMAVSLHEAGLFTWPEWTEALAAAMRADPASAPCGEATYQAWLCALEAILVRKAVTDRDGLAALRDAWDLAARSTPHGQPIVLDARRAHG
ncbi:MULTISPECIES: nitrile hydratase accessory protein [unclassified Methylobacterium]|uniref:nitrile hydratase accessory protein n=1 Tax=unclassified Methylobacterium TaxID=2615210 RepID=UPI0028C4A20A|nr:MULTISPECIES: nitrile hydratase accessory protein [unclassified Methylobacterium]